MFGILSNEQIKKHRRKRKRLSDDANADITASLPKGLDPIVNDPFIQMTKSITVSGSPTKTMSFKYSADNERVLKTESYGTTKNSNFYIRGNNENPITEKANLNNSLSDRIYIYRPAGLIAFRDATATYFVIKDHLGSTRVLFRSTGTQYTTYDYSPFGSLMRASINGDVRFRFTGQEFESEKSDLAASGIYDWLGFEGAELIFKFLDEAINDNTIEIDAMIYDFNEPDLLARLESLGNRLCAIIDDSATVKNGKQTGHKLQSSAESKTAKRLRASAGKDRIIRGHFKKLQHNKIFIAKRNGIPFKVLAGSTNFTFRGLYIQANNVLVFSNSDVAQLFSQMFDTAFNDMDNFNNHPLSSKWHLVKPDNLPAVHICFSPHKLPDLALNPVGGAIDQATSSVFYAVAFLYQTQSGDVREALDRLIKKPVFSYGVSDKKGNLELKKPDGSKGLVDFTYLANNAPEPFKSEWSGGKGINIHHKFVVTDFNKPTAKVFTGSSNLSPSGEKNNGDHLIMIEDQRIATAFAIESLRMFDHLHFRVNMKEAGKKAPDKLLLKKPIAISGKKKSWFEDYYLPNSQKERDRKLFSS